MQSVQCEFASSVNQCVFLSPPLHPLSFGSGSQTQQSSHCILLSYFRDYMSLIVQDTTWLYVSVPSVFQPVPVGMSVAADSIATQKRKGVRNTWASINWSLLYRAFDSSRIVFSFRSWVSSFVSASLVDYQTLLRIHFCILFIQFNLCKNILKTVLHFTKVLQLAECTLQLRV